MAKKKSDKVEEAKKIKAGTPEYYKSEMYLIDIANVLQANTVQMLQETLARVRQEYRNKKIPEVLSAISEENLKTIIAKRAERDIKSFLQDLRELQKVESKVLG